MSKIRAIQGFPRFFGHQDWHVADNIPGKSYTVQGIMVYSLNNVRLLCPESARKQYRNMLQFILWDLVYDQNRSNELNKASARYQPFVQGGITRLSQKYSKAGLSRPRGRPVPCW